MRPPRLSIASHCSSYAGDHLVDRGARARLDVVGAGAACDERSGVAFASFRTSDRSARARSASRVPCRAAPCPWPRPRRGRGTTDSVRYSSVLSQSIAGCSHGSTLASGLATTCAAAYATRFNSWSRFGNSPIARAADRVIQRACRRPAEVLFQPFWKSHLASAMRQCRHVDPAPLGPALQAQLGELHALRAFEQIPAETARLRRRGG